MLSKHFVIINEINSVYIITFLRQYPAGSEILCYIQIHITSLKLTFQVTSRAIQYTIDTLLTNKLKGSETRLCKSKFNLMMHHKFESKFKKN